MRGFLRQHARKLKRRTHKNPGQALIIFVFMLTGLVGMMGLAIDGGRLFFTQRDAQNAVDAAILASARSLCVDDEAMADGTLPADTWQTKGINAATANGFINGVDDTTVSITHPTQAFLDGVGAPGDPTEYTVVSVTRALDPFFIQIVYQGPLSVTVDGIARCNPGSDFTAFDNYALVSCDQDCTNGNPSVKSNGNGGIEINNGGIFSNCSVAGPDAVGNGGIEIIDPAPPEDPPPGIDAVSGEPCVTASGGGTIPPPEDIQCNQPSITCPILTEPDEPATCTGQWTLYGNATDAANGTNPISTGTGNDFDIRSNNSGDNDAVSDTEYLVLEPGCYNSISMTNGGNIIMNPGEFYVKQCMSFNGGNFTAIGAFVYIASSCGQSAVDVQGSGTITWSGVSGGPYNGLMLLHQACYNISVSGGGTITLSGTIYAPCSDISLTGNGAAGIPNLTFTGQIIGGNIDAGGNGGVRLNYGEPWEIPPTPPSVTIVQ